MDDRHVQHPTQQHPISGDPVVTAGTDIHLSEWSIAVCTQDPWLRLQVKLSTVLSACIGGGNQSKNTQTLHAHPNDVTQFLSVILDILIPGFRMLIDKVRF